MNRENKFFAYILWLLPTLFFAYQFTLRNLHGLVVDDMLVYFNINATKFALFSAIFYAIYALMQVPVGVLLDKYQLKYILPAIMLVFVLGSLVFAASDNFYVALFARILMAFGSVIGFLGAAKIASIYFDRQHYNLLVSLTFTIGFIGATLGGEPIAIMLSYYNWHEVINILSIIGFIIVVLSFIIIPYDKNEKFYDKTTNLMQAIKYFGDNKIIMLVAAAGGFLMGSTEGFADAWGVKYLQVAYDLSLQNASLAVSMVYIGLFIGAPLLTIIAQKARNELFILLFTAILMIISFAVLLLSYNLHLPELIIYCFLIGLGSGSQVIIFTINSRLIDKKYIGITAGLTNSIVMLSGFFIHILIGATIDLIAVDKQSLLTAHNLRLAVAIIPSLMLAGIFVIYLVNRKLKQI